MLSCNAYVSLNADAGVTAETTGLLPAARHLVNGLHRAGHGGPNTSQDTLDVSQKEVTIPGRTLVLSPSALATASGAAGRRFDRLLVPSDVQRAPLMVEEKTVSAANPVPVVKSNARSRDQRFPHDAAPPGQARHRVSQRRARHRDEHLAQLAALNGMSLAEQLGEGSNVKIKPYRPANLAADTSAIVTEFSTTFVRESSCWPERRKPLRRAASAWNGPSEPRPRGPTT